MEMRYRRSARENIEKKKKKKKKKCNTLIT